MGKDLRTILFIVAMLLTGCAAAPSVKFAELNLPLAEQGKLKWSDYYTGLYNAAMQTNDAGVMGRANAMIQGSLAYERGQISAEQFQFLRRQAQTGQATDDALADARRRAAWAAAAKSMSESSAKDSAPAYQIVRPAPVTTTNTNCTTFGGQLNCTSRTQ